MLRAATVRPLDDAVVAAYDAPFPTPESRVGVVTFPELLPTEREHPSFAAMNEVAQALREWDKPALVAIHHDLQWSAGNRPGLVDTERLFAALVGRGRLNASKGG